MKEKRKNYDWPLDSIEACDYRYVENIFDEKECELIKSIGLMNGLDPGLVGGDEKSNLNYNVRNSNISFIPNVNDDLDMDNSWLFRKLTDVVVDINKNYFRFDLTRIETLQFTTYSVGQFYDKHVDKYPFSYHNARKLSFSVQLDKADSYDGGDLLIHTSKNPIVGFRQQGSISFFPSYILHEVAPVFSGKRHSLVGWVLGPNFK